MPQPLDPMTHGRRGVKWSNIQSRLNSVMSGGQQKGGFNRKYYQRILRIPEKMDDVAKNRKWPPFVAMQKKSMLTARMMSYYADHIVKALQRAYEKDGQKLTAAQENAAWHDAFQKVIYRYRNEPLRLPLGAIKTLDFSKQMLDMQRMPERENIVHLMRHIPDLIEPPARIIKERTVAFSRRPKQIQKIILTLERMPQQDMETNLITEVDHILGKNISEKEKAHKICFAASIYADAQERKPQPENKKQTWSLYYAEAMFEIYEKITDAAPNIIDEIQQLQ